MREHNPLFWLELRVRVREKRLWLIALFFVGTLAVISGVALTVALVDNGRLEPSAIGNGLVWATLFCQLGLLVTIAPLAAAGRLAQEREQRTLAGLINSPLTRTRIAVGKLLGAWAFVLWLALLAVPFLLVGSLWGGPSLPLVLGCLALNILVGWVLSAVALGISGLFGRSLTAYLATGAFLFGWLAVMPMLGMLALGLHSRGSALYQQCVAYVAWHHHPFIRLAALVDVDWALFGRTALLQLGYALGVWLALAALGLALAVHSLRREVY